MSDQYIRTILYLLFIGAAIMFLLMGKTLIGIIILMVFYFLFGFVTIAFIYKTLGDNKMSGLLTSLTFPFTLLQTEKAYYFWLKASFHGEIKKDYSKALWYALKVNEKNLSTDNARSFYNSYLACLFFDLNECDKAMDYLKRAKEIPHRTPMDEYLERLENNISENVSQ